MRVSVHIKHLRLIKGCILCSNKSFANFQIFRICIANCRMPVIPVAWHTEIFCAICSSCIFKTAIFQKRNACIIISRIRISKPSYCTAKHFFKIFSVLYNFICSSLRFNSVNIHVSKPVYCNFVAFINFLRIFNFSKKHITAAQVKSTLNSVLIHHINHNFICVTTIIITECSYFSFSSGKCRIYCHTKHPFFFYLKFIVSPGLIPISPASQQKQIVFAVGLYIYLQSSEV